MGIVVTGMSWVNPRAGIWLPRSAAGITRTKAPCELSGRGGAVDSMAYNEGLWRFGLIMSTV